VADCGARGDCRVSDIEDLAEDFVELSSVLRVEDRRSTDDACVIDDNEVSEAVL
jgi:hypothetical protein